VRLTGIDGRIADLENRMETRFGQIDQRFMWLTGIVIGTWITTILTILFHR
jgi:tetrahydromethanopterin S-methyltransferase subunit G